MRIVPYLIFDGQCEDAIHLYKKVFDGEVTSLMRWGEAPEDPNMVVADNWKQKVMHAEMKFGGDLWIYLSDSWKEGQAKPGNHISVHLDVDSEETLKKYFSGLADGGEVTMPVDKTFWGAIYGSLIDKYGVSWGFNSSVEE